jgi:hypothetical protein
LNSFFFAPPSPAPPPPSSFNLLLLLSFIHACVFQLLLLVTRVRWARAERV